MADDEFPETDKTTADRKSGISFGSSVERRKFLALLGATGAYVSPALVGVLGTSRTAFGQTPIVSASSSAGISSSVSHYSGSGSSLPYPSSSSGGYPSSSGSGSGSGSYPSSSSSSYTSSGSGSASGPSPSSSSGEVSSGSGSGSSSGSSGSSSSSGGGHGGTIYAIGDTFIRQDSPNTNEGWNPLVRVGVGPVTRGLVLFDRDEVLNALPPDGRVHLVLRIAGNHNNWGQSDDRTVDVYPLLESFVEGNGRQSGMPGFQAVRGTGHGATWNSPDDPDVQDDYLRRTWRGWRGGYRVGRRTAAGVVHVNQVIEQHVKWDVTQDVLAAYPVIGWVIRVTDEGGDPRDDWDRDDRWPWGFFGRGRGGRPRPGEDEGQGGTVEYYSLQGAAAIGKPNHAPKLVISD
jgi:hypothetical protein